MPLLKNARHECFAQAIAKGATATDAYVTAGYKRGDGNASKLASRLEVQARIHEIIGLAAKLTEMTIADMAKQLDEDRTFARGLEKASAAVAASMGKARVLGLIRERHEHTGAGGGPIKHDLSGLSEDQLAQLESIIGSVADARRDTSRDQAEGGEA